MHLSRYHVNTIKSPHMRKQILVIAIALSAAIPAMAQTVPASPIHIIPEPVSVTPAQGSFALKATTAIYAGKGTSDEASMLASMLNTPTGFHLRVQQGVPAGAAGIILRINAAPVATLGDEGYTLSEFAAEISRQSGKSVPYLDMPEAEYRAALVQAGVPAPIAAMLADSDHGAAQGGLDDTDRQLSTLIGRPTTPMAATVAAALAG